MADKKVPKKMKNTQEQDYITNKIMVVFSLCLFGVMALWYVNNLLFHSSRYMLGLQILDVARWGGAALVALSIVLLVMERKHEPQPYKLLTGRNLLIVSVLFTVMVVLVDMDPLRMIKLFYGILPALAVYYLVYHSYQPEFFLVTTDVGVAAALLVGVRLSQGGTAAYVAAGIAVVLAAAQIYMAKTRLSGSRLPAGFGPNAWMVISATAAAMAVLVIAGVLLGPAKVFYLLCIAAAYLFILAVYYTVKLM